MTKNSTKLTSTPIAYPNRCRRKKLLKIQATTASSRGPIGLTCHVSRVTCSIPTFWHEYFGIYGHEHSSGYTVFYVRRGRAKRADSDSPWKLTWGRRWCLPCSCSQVPKGGRRVRTVRTYTLKKTFLKVPATLLMTHTLSRSRYPRLYLYLYSLARSPPRSFFFGFGGSAHVHYFGPSVCGRGGAGLLRSLLR